MQLDAFFKGLGYGSDRYTAELSAGSVRASVIQEEIVHNLEWNRWASPCVEQKKDVLIEARRSTSHWHVVQGSALSHEIGRAHV